MHVILDIDGTVADAAHRIHFVKQQPKDWDSFLAPDRVLKDTPIAEAQRVVKRMVELRYHIVFLTGRNESLRDVTSRWLLEHFEFDSNDFNLLMRPVSNMLSASEYKAQAMQQLLAEYKATGANDFIFIEDTESIFEVFGAEGLVLKAPACWSLMFPAETKKEEV